MKGKIKRDTSGLVVHIPENIVRMLGLKAGDEVNVQFNVDSDIPAPKNLKSTSAKKDKSTEPADPLIKGSLYEVEYLRDKNDETAHVARIVSGVPTGSDVTDRKNLTSTLKYIEGSSVVLIDYRYIKDVKKSPLEVEIN